MKNEIDISYVAIKEIIAVLEKHGVPYSFKNYYDITGLIQGHGLTIDTEICTEELDEEDRLYNEG